MTTLSPCDDDLAQLVEATALALSPFVAGRSKSERSQILFANFATPDTGASAIATKVAADESWRVLQNGWLESLGSGQIVQPHMLPWALVRSAIDGSDVREIISQFRALANTSEMGVDWYAAVVGALATSEVQLASDIDLLPWASVPDHDQKVSLSRDDSKFDFDRPNPFIAYPTCAIRIRLPKRQIFFASHEDARARDPGGNRGASELGAVTARALDIVRCAVAAASAPLAIVGSWSRFSNPAFELIRGTAYQHTHALSDWSLTRAAHQPASLDTESLRSLIDGFSKHSRDGQSALRVVLDRFNSALRYGDPVDKAIDMGIALEAMTLNDVGVSGELTYRASIRGAKFLGGSTAVRARNFSTLKRLYELRSSAVHTGRLASKTSKAAQALVDLDEGVSCVLGLGRKLVLNGKFPNWEDVVLRDR